MKSVLKWKYKEINPSVSHVKGGDLNQLGSVYFTIYNGNSFAIPKNQKPVSSLSNTWLKIQPHTECFIELFTLD